MNPETLEYNQRINDYAGQIFKANKAVGWWDDMHRCFFTTLQLVSTEIAEATEGERKGIADTHLKHRAMGEVELADTLIRLLDIAGRCGWKFETTVVRNQLLPWWLQGFNIFHMHLLLNDELIKLLHHITPHNPYATSGVASIERQYSRFVDAIIGVANTQGYDIWGAMDEKLAYNKTRLDHKRSEREKEGGKSV